MKCCKCDEPSAHGVAVRIGEPTPDAEKGDKSGVLIRGLCKAHWLPLLKYLNERSV